MTLTYIQSGAVNSRAVVHNGQIFMSGIVADNKTNDMKEQTADVLAKIDGILAEAGSDKTKIVSVVVYISDMALKDEMNQVWIEWMGSNNPPARACVGVTLTPDTLVEIMCQAVQG
jgi:enamine deaminase RidA (YjgF/YER057c/UK114 family)